MIKNLYVLGGGLSKRFKKDKLLIKFKNKFLIDILFDEIGSLFDNHYLVLDQFKNFQNSKFNLLQDIYNIKTPLNGIITSLQSSNTDKNFICACDMPFIKKEVVEYLLSFDGYDVVVPYDGQYFEPLCSVYSKSFLQLAKKCIHDGIFSINNCILFSDNIKTVPFNDLKIYDDKLISFFNINSIDDLKEIDGFEY